MESSYFIAHNRQLRALGLDSIEELQVKKTVRDLVSFYFFPFVPFLLSFLPPSFSFPLPFLPFSYVWAPAGYLGMWGWGTGGGGVGINFRKNSLRRTTLPWWWTLRLTCHMRSLYPCSWERVAGLIWHIGGSQLIVEWVIFLIFL